MKCHDTGSEIVIPNAVQTISRSAFRNCRHLESVTLPRSLKTIESEAFHFGDLAQKFYFELVIPESVTRITPGAISGQKLKSITFKCRCDLGPLIFAACKALRSVTVPSGARISDTLFSFCPEENEKAMNKLRITYVV